MKIAPLGQNYTYSKKQASFKGRMEELLLQRAVEEPLKKLPILNKLTVSKMLNSSYLFLKNYFERGCETRQFRHFEAADTSGTSLSFKLQDGEDIYIDRRDAWNGPVLELTESSSIGSYHKTERTSYELASDGTLFNIHEQSQGIVGPSVGRHSVSQKTSFYYDRDKKLFVPC